MSDPCNWTYRYLVLFVCLFVLLFFLLGIYFIYISNAIPKVPNTLPHLLPHPPTPTSWPWRSPVLRHIKFARPMGLSFHWWPTRPSSDTYAARNMSSGGVLVSSYCCSTYRVALMFLNRALVVHPLIPALGRQRQVDFWVQGHPGLQNEFQDRQGWREKPCLEKQNIIYSYFLRIVALAVCVSEKGVRSPGSGVLDR
jgi:hypothetical protein